MRTKLLLLLLLFPIALTAQKRFEKKADADMNSWRYQLETVSVGTKGTCVVKVWSFSKKPEIAVEQASKNAIHAAIFKGIPQGERIPGKKPFIDSSSQADLHADFFNSFFEKGGEYARFVTLTNSGNMAAGDVVKVSKKEYKVGIVVTISYDELRKHLENEGIISKLTTGF